jgi:hypothetical protein
MLSDITDSLRILEEDGGWVDAGFVLGDGANARAYGGTFRGEAAAFRVALRGSIFFETVFNKEIQLHRMVCGIGDA